MKKPFLYSGDAPIEWTFGQVSDLIKGLEEMGCLNDVVAEADRQKLFLSLPPNSVNFVKEFLFERGLHKTSQRAREIIASAACGGGNPAHCVPDCIPETCIPVHEQ
jgi:hypothetical protein